MKRIVPRPGVNKYMEFRRRIGSYVSKLEAYSLRFFGEGNSPFGLTGALIAATLIVSAVTGLLMLFSYSPSPQTALADVRDLASDLRFGHLLRSIHRISADFLIIMMLFHLLRMWATGRYTGVRACNWRTGLVAFALASIIGWAGYILPWDSNALVLLAWGRELVYSIDRWPVLGWLRIGTIAAWPVFGVSNESDQLLRIFGLHIGGAFVLILLAFRHVRYVRPPKIRMPWTVWLSYILVIWLVASMVPFDHGRLAPFNPFHVPDFARVDIFVNFPLLFFPLFGAAFLSFISVFVWVALLLLPRIELVKSPVAVVSNTACTGCRVCFDDCPYAAIEMVACSQPVHSRQTEIAKIKTLNCASCGICVGSCAYGAIELPSLTSTDITRRIRRILTYPDDPVMEPLRMDE